MEIIKSEHNLSITSRKRDDALPPPPPRSICEALSVDEITIEWLAGDGSDRCYYRLSSPQLMRSYVLMQLSGQDAKALRENGYEWIQVGQLLNRNDIFVPKTVATMPDYAAIVIEDYGDIMMESMALDLVAKEKWQELQNLYGDALTIVAKFLGIPPSDSECWTKRSFDQERFQWELDFFQKEFLIPVTNIVLSHSEQEQFKKESKDLSVFLAQYSKYFVHRDFHSRNLMAKNRNLAVIDFQDARFGPPSYDAVSLCFDSYIPIDLHLRQAMMDDFIGSFDGNSLIQGEIVASWRPMLLQRQLKAIGSFGFLSIKKNRGNYLKYLRPALQTLDSSLVGDSRWPLLSIELVQRINSNLG